METMADAGKKRKSDGVPVIKRIGKLSFNRNDVLGRGSFGFVYQGKFRDSIDVAIKRIMKGDSISDEVETVIMAEIDSHPNVLKYYCVEEDDDFM